MAFTAFLIGLAIQTQPTNDDVRLISLAKRAVVAEAGRLPPPATESRYAARPVFVTIEIGGKVRGCRGDLQAHTSSLDAEVIQAARAASQHDPRYRPIQVSELQAFAVTVTVVDRLEPIQDLLSLRPDEGLVLQSGDRTGVVLPFEGRDPATRLKWAYRKAGVGVNSPVKISRLIARRFRG